MQGILRRLLWTLPATFIVSALAFSLMHLAFASATAEGGSERMPLFVNLAPQNVVDLTHTAMKQVATGGAEQKRGEKALLHIGGAAFPHVLPELDRLPPQQRARVALALLPIAERMGVVEPGKISSGAAAVVFFTRFWQDRSIDFRPSVVRRLVKRLRQRGLKLRYSDLIELDTYALPELISELRRAQADEDWIGLSRISTVLSHITQKPWQLDETADARQAKRIATVWRNWWDEQRGTYSSLDAASRIAAMLIQTEYGRWATQTARHGVFSSGLASAPELGKKAMSTLFIAIAAVLGGVGGAWLGANAATRPGLGRRARKHYLVAGAMLLFVPLLVRSTGLFDLKLVFAAYSALALWLLRSFVYQRAGSLGEIASKVPCPGSVRRLIERPFTAISLLATDLPLFVTLVFSIEVIVKVDGLGSLTLQAIHHRDINWLMAVGVCATIAAALLEVLSDALLMQLGLHRRQIVRANSAL